MPQLRGPRSGDFNGDGRDDIITWVPSGNVVRTWVALSRSGANAFGPGTLWQNNFPETSLYLMAGISYWP